MAPDDDGPEPTDIPQSIIDLCEDDWDAHKNDCSGFVKAVASDLSITLTGLADSIVDQIQGGDWVEIADGVEAAEKAAAGWFVIGGLKGADNVPPQSHGHVVVVVKGPLAHGAYPTGYWGKLGSVGAKNTTINYAWNADSRDKVIYAGIEME